MKVPQSTPERPVTLPPFLSENDVQEPRNTTTRSDSGQTRASPHSHIDSMRPHWVVSCASWAAWRSSLCSPLQLLITPPPLPPLSDLPPRAAVTPTSLTSPPPALPAPPFSAVQHHRSKFKKRSLEFNHRPIPNKLRVLEMTDFFYQVSGAGRH